MSKDVVPRTSEHGVWVAFYADMSDIKVFADELEALRYAVEHSMRVQFVLYGEDIKR